MTLGKQKGRWRCVHKKNDCQLDLTEKMFLACCKLHNIFEEHGDQYFEDIPVMPVNMEPPAGIYKNVNSRRKLADGLNWAEFSYKQFSF